MAEALTLRPDFPLDSLEDIILGLPVLLFQQVLGENAPIPPASRIELAVGLQPTVTLFWLGSNDLLGTALRREEPTPIEEFQQNFSMAAGVLLILTDTHLVVGAIPNVTGSPFLISVAEIAALAGAPPELIGFALGVGTNDFLSEHEP